MNKLARQLIDFFARHEGFRARTRASPKALYPRGVPVYSHLRPLSTARGTGPMRRDRPKPGIETVSRLSLRPIRLARHGPCCSVACQSLPTAPPGSPRAFVAGLAAVVLWSLSAVVAGPLPGPGKSLVCPRGISTMTLHVQGAQLRNSAGKVVELRGVNIPSLEWTNTGEHVAESLQTAIHVWKCTIVRIELSQTRWFGLAPGQKGHGMAYRKLVDGLVAAAGQARVYVILNLQWSDLDRSAVDARQHRLPDARSAAFWQSVATRYRNWSNVWFDLYSETHGVNWAMWLHGGLTTAETRHTIVIYRAWGMQQLYDTVRRQGAENIVVVPVLGWGANLVGLLNGYRLRGHNIIYDTHIYPFMTMWKKHLAAAVGRIPLMVGEWGGGAKNLLFGRRFLKFLDAHGLSWAAWSFNPDALPALIRNWRYDPTPFGALVKTALTHPPKLRP